MEETAYQLLGLEQGPAATDADIRKAYRKLALLKHPDKNPDNPRAADEFAALQKAYELLTDTEARAALDALLKAKAVRAERVAGHDEKRRRMMADLERREKGWEAARTQEESARAKLKAEMERLRRQAAERQAKKTAEQRAAAAQAAADKEGSAAAAAAGTKAAAGAEAAGASAATAAASVGAGAAAQAAGPGELGDEMRERLSRTLKVSWSRKDGEYTAVQLRQIFAAHGPVEDVVLREGKKRKGSALVVMADAAGAAAAAQAVNGLLSNPLLVLPFNKAAAAGAGAGWEEDEDSAAAAATAAAAPGPVFQAAAHMRHAASAPAFAAGAAPAAASAAGAPGAGPAGLGPKPAAPLFAAGARSSSAASLFPSAAPAAGAGSAGGGGGSGAGRPLFAAAAGSGGGAQPPAFAAGMAQQERQQSRAGAPAAPSFPAAAAAGAASSFPGGAAFSSFRPSSFPASTASAVHALGNGALEDATLARMRQAAERRRLIEELQRDDGEGS